MLSKINFNDDEFRASGIFPLFVNSLVKNKLTFMNYWELRNVEVKSIRLTLRNKAGDFLDKTEYLDKFIGAVELVMEHEFELKFRDLPVGFSGSVEFEVLYKDPPKLTVPAISLVYSSDRGVSVVHASTRIANKNEVFEDPFIGSHQTGFDVILDGVHQNYLIFFMGNEKHHELELTVQTDFKIESKKVAVMGNRGSLHVLKLETLFNNLINLNGARPKVSIRTRSKDVFPRYFSMILHPDFSVPTLTHTFFDIKEALNSNPKLENHALQKHNEITLHPSTFIVPVFNQKEFITSLETYDTIAPFFGKVIFRLRNLHGLILDEVQLESYPDGGILQRKESILIEQLFPGKLLEELNQFEMILSNLNSVPVRQKVALNVVKKGAKIGTNICFAPDVLVEKSQADRIKHHWFPIGGPDNFVGTIHNTNYVISSSSPRVFKIEIHRGDKKTLVFDYVLNPGGGILISPHNNPEILEFLGSQLGYAYISSTGFPFNSFFFSFKGGELVAGDHAF